MITCITNRWLSCCSQLRWPAADKSRCPWLPPQQPQLPRIATLLFLQPVGPAQGSGEKEPAHADTQAVPTTQAAQAVHASAEYNLKQHVTYSGPRSQKKVALTFDDGPDTKYTEQILDILKKSNVVATFFVTGEHAAAHPEVMKHIVAGGHEIGNHSWDHTNLTTLSEAQMAEQIEKTDQTIQRFTGQLPTLVRPPYGALSKEVADYAEQSHRIVCWFRRHEGLGGHLRRTDSGQCEEGSQAGLYHTAAFRGREERQSIQHGNGAPAGDPLSQRTRI
ncbi:polysaccharide deacetylase family protein [Paenibacillus sp. TAB 01]|uniref:polysaccharide deacetylase family protein n=1 Tax=Paenibacillus sp. TAB 01 TaxID=3368988 RepID=UPI0037523CEB